MFRVVEIFDCQIVSVQAVGAGRRGQIFDIRLSLGFSGKAAEAILRHVGRWVPEGQSDRAALKDAQGAVPDLIPSRSFAGSIESHDGDPRHVTPSSGEV